MFIHEFLHVPLIRIVGKLKVDGPFPNQESPETAFINTRFAGGLSQQDKLHGSKNIAVFLPLNKIPEIF
jgi:hypothetical protein